MSIRSPRNNHGPVRILRTRRNGCVYEVLLDRQDLALYRRYGWQRHTKGLIRYKGKRKGQGSVLLHRAILKLPPDLYVVFRNGNPFDVRRENMRVITAQEQREMKKKPSIRTVHNGKPSGIGFTTTFRVKPSGKKYVYRVVQASYTKRYRRWVKKFNIGTLGLNEAVRRALDWRVRMIREHGLTPNPELLDMLERVTRMARAGGGFEEIYGGNAEYENSVVQPWETCHWADNREAA